jgi:hypothetical protein
MLFKVWKSPITDEILHNIFQHTHQYILIVHPNYSHKSNAKLPDKTEMKAFIGILYFAGALQSNKQSMEELLGTDRDGIEKFCLVMSQRPFKFLSRCITIQW